MLSAKPSLKTPLTPRTPKTPKKHHNKRELDNIPSQKFKIGYQKVTLDVDLEQNSIAGETEITVLPLDSSLKSIKLDCRGIQIKSIIVNQRRAHFSYDDFLQNQEYMNDLDNPVLAEYKYDPYFDSNSKNISVNQHSMLRTKFYPLFSDQNDTTDPASSFSVCTSELTIRVPESIKLRLQDSSKISFSPIGTNRSMNDTPNTANTFTNSDKVYTPLNIRIIYTVRNLKNGIIFNGGIHTGIPKNLWYCYTFNNDFGCSASSWVPCIDNFHEKPAWDINIVVPKTIGDIGQTILIGTKKAEEAFRKTALQQLASDSGALKNLRDSKVAGDVEDDDLEEEDTENNIEITPLTVVVPDLVSFRESPHPIDVAKKVVNFQFYNPVCAHHLGFAVGCFDKIPIVDVKSGTDELVVRQQSSVEISEDVSLQLSVDTANTNKVPTMLYYLPGNKQEVVNSTIFLYKALEFYSKEFSSFPFTSYTLLFIEGLPSTICTFAGMSIASSRLLYGPELVEPMFETTESLSIALAEQYSGVNVLPKTLNDIWCVSGIARYMSNQFLKKLFGVNYYNFTFQKRCDLLCELDLGKRPLANQVFRFPINSDQDLSFINLKAPLVLMILDRRITKTDKLFGLSRVIPKIFLQAMSNDLINGNNLSTAHFQRVCEKVAHHRLEAFFQNWVYKSGVPTFRITQKFNKKRLFIEMSIRQMQRSNLNKDASEEKTDNNDIILNEKKKNFVESANTFMTEDHHFDAQPVFTGPVTVRIHEADGSPYEHILAISEPLTKLDIQYNTKYRRRKKDKKEGTEDVEEKDKSGEKEKETRKKEKIEKRKVNMLGDVLTTSEELDNWDLKEEQAPNAETEGESTEPGIDDGKDEAFEWLRFDADNEWICKYTLNLTDDKFESQLKQDRDVKAQVESVKYFGNITRPTLSHARILLRTLVDDRYFYGVREEAARALAKISNEENDHIGMRLLLKAYKFMFCYDNEIIKGYNEFDPKEYLPKPNDFTDFSNLFVMKAIIESLSNVRNKDGDAPIELKRIMLHILKYNDNGNNKFDDTYFYSSIIKALCNLIIISKREIPNLNADYTTNDADRMNIRDGKDEFICASISELNRCLKMDEWSPSYKNTITKVVLEQKIRFVRSGLARMTFIDLLKYTIPKYNDDIRCVAFEGLLLIGGLRNSNILNYFFTTLKLDESLYLRYELNKCLVTSIGIAAYSGVPSLLDDEEFLKSVSVFPSGDQSNDTIGNRIIQIEDSASAKLSMQSRKDEMARRTIEGSVDILRRDLGMGKGLRFELWQALHSCLIPINTRRNIFDIMMILYQPKNSFMITTNLPSDKQIIVRVKSKITEASNPDHPSFVVSLRREARFKIQLPVLKLKINDEKVNNKQKINANEASLNLTSTKKGRKKKNDPTSNLVEVKKSVSKFEVKIKLPKKTDSINIKNEGRIIRHDSSLPLRYVRFNLRTKEVTVSTNQFFEKNPKFMVSLKINTERWKSFLDRPLNESYGDENSFPVKIESTVDPDSSTTANKIHRDKNNERMVAGTVKKEDLESDKILDQVPPELKEKFNTAERNVEETIVDDQSVIASSSVTTTENSDKAKSSGWSKEAKSIIENLSPVRRDPDAPSTPSPISLTLGRSSSRSQSPENNEKPKEKKKSGPKIKLRLK